MYYNKTCLPVFSCGQPGERERFAVTLTGVVLYRLVLALWIGGMSLFTFVLTPVIFRSFGRDAAGEIVGRLFPGYFLFNLVLSILALAVFLLASKRGKAYVLCLLLLGAAVAINGFVKYGLHPKIRAVKEEISSFTGTAPDDPLRKRFSRLHAASSILNLMVLADGIALLVIHSIIRE